jgi:hypothetical protein
VIYLLIVLLLYLYIHTTISVYIIKYKNYLKKQVGYRKFKYKKLRRNYIYVIQKGIFVKVGYSSNVIKRIKEFQIGSPFPINLIAIIPVSTKTKSEKSLHRKFKKWRFYGEWFLINPHLLFDVWLLNDVNTLKEIKKVLYSPNLTLTLYLQFLKGFSN